MAQCADDNTARIRGDAGLFQQEMHADAGLRDMERVCSHIGMPVMLLLQRRIKIRGRENLPAVSADCIFHLPVKHVSCSLWRPSGAAIPHPARRQRYKFRLPAGKKQ